MSIMNRMHNICVFMFMIVIGSDHWLHWMMMTTEVDSMIIFSSVLEM